MNAAPVWTLTVHQYLMISINGIRKDARKPNPHNLIAQLLDSPMSSTMDTPAKHLPKHCQRGFDWYAISLWSNLLYKNKWAESRGQLISIKTNWWYVLIIRYFSASMATPVLLPLATALATSTRSSPRHQHLLPTLNTSITAVVTSRTNVVERPGFAPHTLP